MRTVTHRTVEPVDDLRDAEQHSRGVALQPGTHPQLILAKQGTLASFHDLDNYQLPSS